MATGDTILYQGKGVPVLIENTGAEAVGFLGVDSKKRPFPIIVPAGQGSQAVAFAPAGPMQLKAVNPPTTW